MPYSVNGFGTAVIGRRGDVGQNSFDAVEWFVAANLPIVPLACVHTFDWSGSQYRRVPIRWSYDLVARTFFSRWIWIVALAAATLVIMGLVGLNDSGPLPVLIVIGLALAGVAAGMGVCLFATGGRDKRIRLVIGKLTVGNCDPAHFDDELLEKLGGNPRAAYGTKTFAQAVPDLLARGSFAQAMWAARMCAAVEDESEGESLTDEVLNDPDVAGSIEEVRREPRRWKKLMLTEQERAGPDDGRGREQDRDEDDRPRRRRYEGEGRPRSRGRREERD